MKVLLVVTRTVGTSYGFTNFPVGLAYICASLKKAGHIVHVLDLNDYYAPIFHISVIQMLLRRKILEIQPQVVATGGLSAIYDQLFAIVEASRSINKQITTIIGGGCVSSEPELIMQNINADFGVIGEGEQTIVELLEHIENNKEDFDIVDGIIYRLGNKIKRTNPRKPIDDLDSLPFPDYEAFNIEAYLDRQTLTDQDFHPYNTPRVCEIAASRSCPFKCTFCFHPVGDKYRKRSLESVMSEIQYLVSRYKVNNILMNDELFANDKKWLLEFCKQIKQYDVKWQAQLRVDIVDEELIILLKDSGCIYISYGLESASPTILKSMRKKITIEQIENALSLTLKHGILIQGNFIFGDKAETIETIVETLSWWFNHREYRINLSHLIPYPGTALYRYAIEQGLFKKDRIEYIKNGCAGLRQLNLTTLSDDVLNKMMSVILGNLRPGNFKPGRLKGCSFKGCDPYQGHFYSVDMECPYCKTETTYFPIHSKYVRFNLRTYRDFGYGCRNCNQRMTFIPPAIEQQLITLSKNENMEKFAILGDDEKLQLVLKTSWFVQNHCKLIISENDPEIKYIQNIPVKQYINIDEDLANIQGVLKISRQCPSAENKLKSMGVKVFDLSEEFRFLDKDETNEQIQDHLNHVSQKIDQAKAGNLHDETSALLIDVLEMYPRTLDIHRNLMENAFHRNDYKLFFDICYTVAVLVSIEDFARIRGFLINIFPKLIETGKVDECKRIKDVLVFKNPQEDASLIASMDKAIDEKQRSSFFQ
ncbi:MAG: B12-binding domain-containing radical SAM protein [Proteobacteria bacterium]|nr:B12-binding domain-containing radical SAM protein [Pseudomonadota bacterium]MBU2628799.1 B12-binding domain-containing radical SAM protein [Pseudomonadota bacterium]